MNLLGLNSVSSAFMGILFAYSASVQLNDPDWYLWFPLYSIASIVNLMNAIETNRALPSSCNYMVFVAFWCALALFLKVVAESASSNTIQWMEILSLDMEKRVVREKLGSGLVIISIGLLYLRASSMRQIAHNQNGPAKSQVVRSSIEFGIILLVLISGGLCLAFFISAMKI